MGRLRPDLWDQYITGDDAFSARCFPMAFLVDNRRPCALVAFRPVNGQ